MQNNRLNIFLPFGLTRVYKHLETRPWRCQEHRRVPTDPKGSQGHFKNGAYRIPIENCSNRAPIGQRQLIVFWDLSWLLYGLFMVFWGF